MINVSKINILNVLDFGYSPQIQENVQPVKQHIRHLSGKAHIRQEVRTVLGMFTGVIEMQFVVHKIL